MMMQRTTLRLRGFTALELIIVLVVGFSIIALSASKMGQLFSSSATTAATSSILELYASARSLRGANGYGKDDLIPTLIKAKMVPKTLKVTGDVLSNEWNGTITITPSSVVGELGFAIAYPNVPKDVCVKITQVLLSSGNFASAKIGDGEANADADVSAIATACVAGKEKKVDITFNFKE